MNIRFLRQSAGSARGFDPWRSAILLLMVAVSPFGNAGPAAVAVDSQVTVKYSGLSFNRATNTFDSVATLTNISANSLAAPLSLVVTNLSNSTVSLANAAGSGAAGPYIAVPLSGGSLAANQTIGNLLLKFSNPNKVSFSFKASVMQGVQQSAGAQVSLQVLAADPYAPTRPLHYAWKVSEGSIANVDSPGTTWNLPQGPGVHFANVLVSNRLGGYTERRFAVITDNMGIPSPVTPTQDFSQAAAIGNVDFYDMVYFQTVQSNLNPNGNARQVYIPDVVSSYVDDLSGATIPAKSDLLGRVYLYNAGHTAQNSFPNLTLLDYDGIAHPHEHEIAGNYLVGSVSLQNGEICGTDNKFHGVQSTAQAILLDFNGKQLGGSARVNLYGDYALPWNPLAWYVKVQCEANLPVIVGIDRVNQKAAKAVFGGAGQPVVSTITASIGGQAMPSNIAFIPPDDHGQPSSKFPRGDVFLAFKGIDTRQSACEYYRLIGAVKSCDAAGNPSGGISFDDWKRKVGLAPYVQAGGQEYTATYVNRIDLNLTRNHHAITYVNNGGNGTAAYVCNHLGPKTDNQSDIDAAIDNALNGKNLVACVAMDYGYELANGLPYVRYYIFAPNGQLMLSINLDGRREKFMPGTCVACHGGDLYDGQITTDGRASPNFGGHFLPYDVGNFAFSSTHAGFGKNDQQEAIYHLNKIAQTTNLTSIESDLIDNWYAAYRPGVNTPVLDETYWPQDWKDNVGQLGTVDVEQFYKKVDARYCRTCHVAVTRPNHGFNNPEVFASWMLFRDDPFYKADLLNTICGGTRQIHRNHTMPNSLVTFNRMWNDPEAVSLLKQWSGENDCLNNPDPQLQ